MNRRSLSAITVCVIGAVLLAGCAGSPDGNIAQKTENIREESKEETKEETPKKVKKELQKDKTADNTVNEKGSGKKSLAQRMAGKYSYHAVDDDGNEEFYIMDVVPFGDNLYAFCGWAMPDDYESLEAYSFRACEFIPYDEEEMTSTEGDSVTVNELSFSVMSNAGMYGDAGHKGTITLTDDGLVFEGFKNEDFFVPEYDTSRLFLKDDRVEDAFGYLKHDMTGGDEKLQGLWILDNKGADLYLEFKGSDLYIYKKDPGTEVFFAAGGCEYSDGSFECTASTLGYGGMPLELSCDYKVEGDTLTLKVNDSDSSGTIPKQARYSRIKEGKVHVTTMDEVEFDSGSFGMYGSDQDHDELTLRDYYGVFVSASKDRDKCTPVVEKLEEAGFDESSLVYTPDFAGLNPDPYYVATTGLYVSESDADKALLEVKAAGFKDAYVKHAGTYIGDRFMYITDNSEKIEVLKDGVMLRGVSLEIPYRTEGDQVKVDLFVPKDAVFDPSADTSGFGNYESGDTPYDWIVRNHDLMNEDPDRYLMYGPALSGIFEVSLDDNTITRYYGSYRWD